jgi:IMP dehydrogenase
MRECEVGGLLVVDGAGRLEGVVTDRDVRFVEDGTLPVRRVMSTQLVTARPGVPLEEARRLLGRHKIEKLPLVDKSGKLKGLITAKDILKRQRFPDASKDRRGHLLVGAAVGVIGDYLERARALQDAGADVLVMDVAHGHAEHAIAALRSIKKACPSAEVVAGNVATYAGARDLVRAGADGVKVGVGPGATCSTRVVSGHGVPQLSAVLDCARLTRTTGVPICADGGIRDSGDLAKALAAGASCAMIGSLFAGTDESPGWTIVREGMRYKVYRGMASLGATLGRRQKENARLPDNDEVSEVVPEGVESMVPYRGHIAEVVHQLVGGLRSGLSYSGARDLKAFQKKAKFVRITAAGWAESIPRKGVIN